MEDKKSGFLLLRWANRILIPLPKGKGQSICSNMSYVLNDSVDINRRTLSCANISSLDTQSVAHFPGLPLFFVSSCFLRRMSHFHKVSAGEIQLSPYPISTAPPSSFSPHWDIVPDGHWLLLPFALMCFVRLCESVWMCKCRSFAVKMPEHWWVPPVERL